MALTQHSSFLPWPSEAILSDVARFQMLTSSQLRRLHYRSGTARGQKVRSSKHLKRLTELGMLKRIQGIYDRAPEYIYLPPSSKARRADMHTLDINELYVRLTESTSYMPFGGSEVQDNSSIIFDGEPWCHVQVGHMTLKPDAYMQIGNQAHYVEMDRGTEFRSMLSQKMRRYVSAFEYRWRVEGASSFPQVLFVCHDSDRQRFIENVIRSQSEPRLFVCHLFSEVIHTLTN